MRLFSWLRERIGGDRLTQSALPRGSKSRPVPRVRLRLEALEDRCVPSTLTVLNINDSGAGSLRADIAAAHSGDTIVFAPSLNNQTITLTSGELLVNKNLTIAGPGAGALSISGDHLSRVFEVANGKKTTTQVALSGLTINNGIGVAAAGSSKSTDGSGGGILVDAGAALTVNNSTLSGNKASSGLGGGISNDGMVTVTGSTLSNNSALGGGGILNGGTLTVSGSILSGNVASTGQGGGIANLGPLTVSGSTLSNNSAGSNGGGISNAASVPLTVSGSTLSNNSAGSNGGGIYNAAGTVTVSSSSLLGNAADDGGGIWSQGKTVTINGGSTLSGNTARYDGGGIYIYSGAVTISGSTVGGTLPGNSAARAGGGIFIFSYATVTVENSSSITGNSAPFGFGADVDNLGLLYLDVSSIIGILDGNPAKRI